MPVNNNDIQRAETLNRILELTNKIAQGSTGLNLGAVQAQNFAKGLETIRARAQEATSDLGRLNQQLLKVAASIETANPSRIRLGGGQRISTGQYVQPYQNSLTQQGVSVLSQKEAEASRLLTKLQGISLSNTLNQSPTVITNPEWTNFQEPQNRGTTFRNASQQADLGFRTTRGYRNEPFTEDNRSSTYTYTDEEWKRWTAWNQADDSRKAKANQARANNAARNPPPYVNNSGQAPNWSRTGPPGWTPPPSWNNPPPPTPSGGSWGGYPPPPPNSPPPPGSYYTDPSSPGWGTPNAMKGKPQPTIQYGKPIGPYPAPPWYEQASKRAAYYGFKDEDLKGVNTEASSGISRLNYRAIDEATGAFKNLNLTVDKSGNVLVDTQKRFRDFFSEVGRNTVEFLKWSLAVSLVLGPLQKFSELMQTAIENESKLADISVSLASGQTTVAQVFSASAEIANKAGEEINTVLDAYQIAYRAIGGAADPTTRFTQANKLLSDSMILSKLTGMDEAKAIDTLSAALRQSFSGDGALAQGTTLLDKWVATTKVANVDLETLSTGFAIVGDSADAAGLSIDRLDGLLATIAETGVASGKEVANAARAMISGFQSDQSKKLLSSLGVATEQGGEARSFDDIVSQLAKMRQAGKEGQAGGLSDEQFSKLTLTLGGGSRRQAVWATLIENYDRVGQVAEASSRASGDAQDAMAKKTQTVATSVTRLGNAFQEMAQNIGTKGGMLDNFKMLLELGTGLVKVFDGLTSTLGKAFPVAIAGVGALAFLGSKSQQTRTNASLGGIIAGLTIPQGTTKEGTDSLRNFRATAINASPITRTGTGLLAAAVPILSNMSDDSLTSNEKYLKVGADIAGGVIGSLGGPAGAIIGVTIAEAFTSSIIANANKDYSGVWSTLVTRVQGIEVDKEGKKLTPGQQKLQEAQTALGKWGSNIGTELGIIPGMTETMRNSVLTKQLNLTAKVPFEQGELLNKGLAEKYGKTYTPRRFEDLGEEEVLDLAIANTTGELKELYKGIKDGLVAVRTEGQVGPTKEVIDAFYNVNKEVIDTASSALSAEMFIQFGKGNVNRSGLTRGLTASKNLNTIGTNWYQALGQGKDVSQFFEKTSRITAFGSDEDINAITNYANEIFNYDKIINDATKSEEEHTKAIKAKNEAMSIATTLIEQDNQAILASAQLAPVVDIYGYDAQQDKMIKEGAITTKKAELAQQVSKGVITQAQADAKLKESTPFLTQMSDTNYGFYGKGEVDQASYEQERDRLIKEGVLPKYGKDKGVEIQQYDLKSPEFNKILTEQYPELLSKLEASGYKEEKSDIIPVLQDKILPQMQLDTKVMALLLQQIADNTKDMVGEFNLPEGMSFNIPYTWLSNQNKGDNLGPVGGAKPTVGGSKLAGYEETPYYGEVKADLYPSKTNAVQNYDWEKYARMGSTGGAEESDLSTFKRLEAESLLNPYGINSGRGTYAPGEGFTAPDAGTGISAITDRLNVLNNSLQEFADRPINLNLNTTAILTMDSKVIGEAVSRYIGIRLSALGGTFTGARPIVAL